VSLLLGGCLPRRRGERRCELQPPLSEGQPPHAALTQSGCQRRSQDQRKHLRDCVSPLSPAPGTQSSHRGHCPSTVSTDLADPAPGRPLRRTRPSRHQTIQAKAHGENDTATPKPRLSDRSAESSTQPSTSAMIFDPAWLVERIKYLYTADPLKAKLQEVFGSATTLEPDNLKCLLLIVTKNVTTDSPWPVSSNPDAKYNDPARKDCNLQIPLWQLVRSSTAAPVFFPPEVVQWDPTDQSKTFVFVDGGVTPYNNPAFLLYRMATDPAYCLSWETGEDNLLLISVGTGAA